MTGTWLLRMARWLRHPPSPARVRLVLAVLGLCLALAAIERWIGWPDALSAGPLRPLPKAAP
ncbi:hypothetical protein PVT71_14240 [Salipiger sp. H15]|uniref:Uncharacterized protein n=1 Tax=Alloyangia sp. H15 TaxID=3029062 RepID=A0AAU8AGI0_9RHOB